MKKKPFSAPNVLIRLAMLEMLHSVKLLPIITHLSCGTRSTEFIFIE